jgi:hypothetical protein
MQRLYPLNPVKILNNIPRSFISQSDKNSSNITEIGDISLTSCTITDITTTPILQSVHTKINHLVMMNAINTPVRRLIPQLNMAHEIALASNKIMKMQLKEIQDVLGARKERQSGKRKILKGHNLVSTKEFEEKIAECEKKTKKSRQPRKRNIKKDRPLTVIVDDEKEENEDNEERE